MINDLETQFQSGVNMVLMMGLLEGYYIPHYLWHYTPKNFEERVRMSVGNTKGFVGGGGEAYIAEGEEGDKGIK